MKYPSADSLNSATDFQYTFEKIISMEQHFLSVINWELLHYTPYDFLNIFLSQGCLFKTDKILQGHGDSKNIMKESAKHLRQYADFFADFALQESELLKVRPQVLASSVVAFARKHLNLEVIWPPQMELVCNLTFEQIRAVFCLIDSQYRKAFFEHACS